MSKLYAIRQTGKSNYWYDFVEDFTSAELDEHCVSNDLVYVKECQNNLGDLNPAWKNSEIVELGIVADLEAKLAESEKEHELLIDQFEEETEKLRKQIKQESDARKRFVEEVKNLKQQLAEKECEIKKLNTIILVSQLQAPEEQRLKIIGSSCCQYNPNQDKISFAVEQLEKVKASIEVRIVIIQENYTDDLYTEKEYLDMTVENENILKKIDNQIKQLKEGK